MLPLKVLIFGVQMCRPDVRVVISCPMSGPASSGHGSCWGGPKGTLPPAGCSGTGVGCLDGPHLPPPGKDYSRYDGHVKEKTNLLPTQPICIKATNGGIWSQVVVKTKHETSYQTWSKLHKVSTGETKGNTIPTTAPAITTNTVTSTTENLPVFLCI